MEEKQRTYIAIDLKSFYASVECVEKGFDPLDTNLVVADESRTSKTICLAVSPSLKSFGVPGRPRLFEVEQIVKQLNEERRRKAPGGVLSGKSALLHRLEADSSLAIDYVTAMPRMGLYIEFSTKIYDIYLKYVSKDDIHIYSIDEVFIDATDYLNTYRMTAHEFAMKMIEDIMINTGVTATAGIGTNLYLAKVAMDIVAKHKKPDKDGVRIAELDEMSYRKILWTHEPLTDFWRVGRGIAKRLLKYNIHTMGDIAEFSLRADGVLYDEFGINAELLIDHAWGYEPCTMKDIKAYRPVSNSLSSGQVLMEPYTFEKAKVVCKEMIDNLCLDMVEKGLVTDSVGLWINYDSSNDLRGYKGKIVMDYYGKRTAKPAKGTVQLDDFTSSSRTITAALMKVYDLNVDPALKIRRITITANRVISKNMAVSKMKVRQFDLFHDAKETEKRDEQRQQEELKEENLAKAILDIKHRFGKNMILKGTNFEDGATGRQRNEQIGGHKE
ncbi:MAG: DNA methylase [Erysipelotrichaceae bacterium]|nr:DNA methylase [Erysipelotrichaceae bacterium]